jgi:uncharacterized membrane protein
MDIATWLNIAVRWFHVIAGITWIGSSFYFIWLDNALKAPTDAADKKNGVGGEVWAVHGGGFYHKKKYGVAPSFMPADLHWFKWEAYATWTSGFLLLILIYYFNADLYLIDKGKMDLSPPQAIVTGLAFIGGGWLFYDNLCKSRIGGNNKLFGVIWFLALAVSGYFLNHIFSGRGMFIHIGAMTGTAMAANVFAIIIPNQKIVVADLLAGRTPDPKYGKKAKQRSTHNNYMTLPVVLIMISNHYPILYDNPLNWLVLAGVAVASLSMRHFFNLKHKGQENYTYLFMGTVIYVLVLGMLTGGKELAVPTGGAAVTDAEARAIIRTHCSACHSDMPTHASVSEAPQGLMYDKMDEIRLNAPRIYEQAVEHEAMPLGNETKMTREERDRLGAWLKSVEKK